MSAASQFERSRVSGTRLLKFATHFPCIVLCLVRPLLATARSDCRPPELCCVLAQMPVVVSYLARMERRMLARQQASCTPCAASRHPG